jgi:predicted alpha/beta-hydrolase family hydrolase
MRQLIIFSLLVFGTWSAFSQDSDSQYRRPLVEVLDQLAEQYQVRIKYDKREIGDFMLKYADFRLRLGDVEMSLKNVLAPFDYTFVKQGGGIYKIKAFQYHLITPEEGAESLEYLKTLYTDKESWEARRSELRTCMRVALGIDQLPNVAKPNIILTGKRTYEGYTVENIGLETIAGLYVAGSIYRPTKPKGKMPIVLSPNGHFGDGRHNKDIQTRCAALAKMGALVVNYDLFAWGESLLQVASTAHRTSIAHTIQANNSIRMLDYLLTTKGVDPERIAITGGSGGGSMTMLISAIDDRIQVSVPVVMTSSFHSGGCPCESGTPIHLCGGKTNNAEIASIFAPKPMLIISDGGDWTFQVPEVEFPFIQRTYGFYDATENVKNIHIPNEGHDYGFSKRQPMYEFMAAKLGLDLSKIMNEKGEIDESKITIEEPINMLAFGEKGEKLPENAILSYEELMNHLNKAPNESK